MAGPDNGAYIGGLARCFYSLPQRCTILLSYLCVRWASLLTALPMECIVELLKFWGTSCKILSLTAFFFFSPFPSQNENTQVALSEESRSEGKVGFKAYKNYLTAGAHCLVIVFLILLNIVAQVDTGI